MRIVNIRKIFFFLSLALIPLQTTLISQVETSSQKVLWVPFEGTVELGLSPFIQRALRYAEEQKFDAVVLEVDTFGGRVDAAVDIRDALLESPVLTVAWVNKRAISAGALISLACDKIIFSGGSTMGAATPIQPGAEGAEDAGKKFVSYFRGEMGATAERNGRPRKIAEAMVMASEDIPDLIKAGEVLTINDTLALKHGISDATLETREEVLKFIDLSGASVEDFEISWAEGIVRFLTEPTVSGLLMSAGVLGLILEIQSPGFGIPGIVGIACIALYFFGKFIVNLAGIEDVLLFILGLILIGVEVFIAPGTLVFALLGLGCIVAALFFAGISPNVPFHFSAPGVQEQVHSIAIGVIVGFLGLIGIYFFLRRNSTKVPLVLASSLEKGGGESPSERHEIESLVGKEGLLLSDLRPAGRAEIEGKTYQVVSESGFLERGSRVKVIDTDGVRILVRLV
jgi:membrane-bound serine protease (ClpP class)